MEKYYEEKRLKNKNEIINNYVTNSNNCQFNNIETTYLISIAYFFDGNCRRNKRIINIYNLAKRLMGKKIQGWYSSQKVNSGLLKKMIKLIVMAEQWPYRISWILFKIEIMRTSLSKFDEDDKDDNYKIKTCKQWVNYYSNLNIIDILKDYKKKELKDLLLLDYDPILFEQFCNQKPFITINTIYLLIPFLFNLNSSIKDRIEEIYNIQ